MRPVQGFCLVLLASVSTGERTGSISFPSSGDMSAAGAADDRRGPFPEGSTAVRSIAGVVLQVLDEEAVRKSPKNWVVSPLGLTATIAQLLLGSRGRLRTALVDSLSPGKTAETTPKLEVHRQLGRLLRYLRTPSNGSYVLELNGAVFVRPEVRLERTYRHALLDFYNATAVAVDFREKPVESTRRINEWMAASTRGKLPELFVRPLPETTISLMANAVYFNGRWDVPFDSEYTRTGPFFVDGNRKVDVPFMFGEKEVLYKNTSELQLIGIPYKNRKVVLYVLLPHDKLKTGLSVDRLDELVSTSRTEKITLVVPRLKLVSTISVRQSVLKYLMKTQESAARTVILSSGHLAGTEAESPRPEGPATGDSFGGGEDAESDFDVGGASEDAVFRFDDVIHQVSLEVDEKGSEVAAATATLIDYAGVNFLLTINRPFWFFIRHESTSTHLFWGRIVNPSITSN